MPSGHVFDQTTRPGGHILLTEPKNQLFFADPQGRGGDKYGRPGRSGWVGAGAVARNGLTRALAKTCESQNLQNLTPGAIPMSLRQATSRPSSRAGWDMCTFDVFCLAPRPGSSLFSSPRVWPNPTREIALPSKCTERSPHSAARGTRPGQMDTHQTVYSWVQPAWPTSYPTFQAQSSSGGHLGTKRHHK